MGFFIGLPDNMKADKLIAKGKMSPVSRSAFSAGSRFQVSIVICGTTPASLRGLSIRGNRLSPKDLVSTRHRGLFLQSRSDRFPEIAERRLTASTPLPVGRAKERTCSQALNIVRTTTPYPRVVDRAILQLGRRRLRSHSDDAFVREKTQSVDIPLTEEDMAEKEEDNAGGILSM